MKKGDIKRVQILDAAEKLGRPLTTFGAMGVSAMMHGYLPFDRDGKQLAEFRKDMAENVFTSEKGEADTLAPRAFELESITLKDDSWLTGKSLRETDMRSYGCMVISVVSGGQVTTNPKPEYRFKAGDIVWLAGEKSACDWWA